MIITTKEQIDEARKNPQFVYVRLGDTWDKHLYNDGGFVLEWGVKNFGFGTLTFIKHGDKVICDTETMSNDFVSKVFEEFVKTLVYK